MSDTTTKTAEYGWLCDYETGNPMRLATEAECSASLIAAILDGGAGIITLDNGQTVFVTGEPTDHAINLLHEEYFRLTAFERKIKKAAKKAGAATSPAKKISSAKNGKRGGRPRKSPTA